MSDVQTTLADQVRAAIVRCLEADGFDIHDTKAYHEPGDARISEVRVEGLVSAVVRLVGHRVMPASWASPDGTEWSGISGDGVLDVRGSKTDIDVVVSWRQAKDRLAWFEEEYKKAQSREAALTRRVEDLNDRLTERMTAQERSAADLSAERAAHWLTKESVDRLCEAVEELKARYDRLLTAFHDATRRPMGVTPDTGLEFYDHRLADEAEARRTRYGRGPK